MKRIASLLLTLLLLTACQPTPEADAVKQKNTEALIETVLNVQEAESIGNASTAGLPDRFQCAFTTAAGNVRVTADVPIEVLSETGDLPTLRVEHRYLSDAERLTLAGRLLRSGTLYIWEYRLTRALLEEQIRTYIQDPTPEEKADWMRETGSSEADWTQRMKNRQAYLDTLQEQYNALPENDVFPPLAVWDGAAPFYSEDYAHRRNDRAIVRRDTDTDDLVNLDHVTVWADETDRPIEFRVRQKGFSDLTDVTFFSFRKVDTVRIDPSDYDRPHAGASISPNEAAALLQSYFDGVGSFRIADVFWTNNGTENEQGKLTVTRHAYLIVLTTDFFGANTPYSSAAVYDSDPTANVVRTWPNEALTAAIDGAGNLISLAWVAPLKATDVIAKQTKLLPCGEIESIFKTQMGRLFASAEYQNGSLTVDAVRLGLYRIREQNSFDSGLLVPAWFFTGTLTFSEAVQTERRKAGFPDWEKQFFDNQNPLLIVNAVDGSVIDPVKGY